MITPAFQTSDLWSDKVACLRLRTASYNVAAFFGGEAAPAQKSRRQQNVSDYARGIADATTANFAELERIEQDMQGSMERLKLMADVLAFLDEHVPGDAALIDEFKISWQALHVQWTPVAEAQKLHWLMAEYLRELGEAGQRYGDGVSAALRTARTWALTMLKPPT